MGADHSARPAATGAMPHLSAVSGTPAPAATATPGPAPEIPLFEAASLLTRLYQRPVTARVLVAEVARQGGTIGAGQVVNALKQHGFASKVRRRALAEISALTLPAVLILRDGGACVLKAIDGQGGAEILLPELGLEASRVLPLAELEGRYTGWTLFAHPEGQRAASLQERAFDEEPAGVAWFWRVLWEQRGCYAESALAAVIVNVLGLALSLFTMNVYDRIVPNQALESLWVLVIGVSIAIGFEFVVRTLRGHFMDVAAKKADLTISSKLFKHVLGLRGDRRPGSAGNFAAQVQGFETVREFIGSAALVTFSDLPFVALYLWVIALIGGKIVLVSLLTIPVVVLAGVLIQLPLNRSIRESTRESYAKQGVLVEAIDGLDTLKAHNAQGFALEQWERACTVAAQCAQRSRSLSALAVNFSQATVQLASVATVAMGVYMVVEGSLTQGALVACAMLSGRALAPLAQIAGLLARYQHARTAYVSLKKLMELPSDRDPARQYLHRPRFSGSVALERVRCAYPAHDGHVTVLDIAGLHIAPGEKVALLGRVGSGKSTLLQVLSGLVAPSEGRVLYDGIDQAQIDPVDVRQNVTHMAQQVKLFRGTLRDNLLLGQPHADTQRMLRYAQMCGVHQWATRHPLGYDMPIAEGGVNLSGGQRQMVALARSLLMDGAIVLLDEPTSALDHGAEQALLARLQQELRNRTVILVSHKPSALALVDRVIIIDGGKIVADGPRDVILKALARPAAAAAAKQRGSA